MNVCVRGEWNCNCKGLLALKLGRKALFKYTSFTILDVDYEVDDLFFLFFCYTVFSLKGPVKYKCSLCPFRISQKCI